MKYRKILLNYYMIEYVWFFKDKPYKDFIVDANGAYIRFWSLKEAKIYVENHKADFIGRDYKIVNFKANYMEKNNE